ncbi:MAG: hypothetical protein P8Z80_17150, partial [Pseudolabrys sp.]
MGGTTTPPLCARAMSGASNAAAATDAAKNDAWRTKMRRIETPNPKGPNPMTNVPSFAPGATRGHIGETKPDA